MTTKRFTPPPIPVPFDGSPAELVQAGREVAELIEHPGFKHLLKAAEGLAEMRLNGLEAPTDEGAVYADVIGERRGLKSINRLALGVIENAKAAERELRTDEERGK